MRLLLLFAGAGATTKRSHKIVAAAGHGFVMAESQLSSHRLGFNYGNRGRLTEDFWTNDWATISRDLCETRQLGANRARFHL